MTVTAFRLTNFMAFGEWPNEDDGWIELRPITLLFGRNSSGKSTVLRALRFLRQSLKQPSLDNGPNRSPFVYASRDGVDVGSFMELVNRGGDWPRETNPYAFDETAGARRRLGFDFRIEVPEGVLGHFPGNSALSGRPKLIDFRLSYAWFQDQERARLVAVSLIEDPTGKAGVPISLFEAEWLPHLPEDIVGPEEWYFASPAWGNRDLAFDNIWPNLTLDPLEGGFLPRLHVPSGLRQFQTDDITAIQTVLESASTQVEEFLKGIEHVRPLRPEPKRTFVLDEDTIAQWKAQGRGAYLRLLSGDFEPDQLARLNQWLDKLELGAEARPRPLLKHYGGVFSEVFTIEQDRTIGEVNLVDVGYGASQIIPVLAQVTMAPSGSLTLIEQPELHLHPRAQAQLGDIFIESSGEDVRLLIETHSEHLILRLQRRIRHSKFQQDQLAVYYSTREEGCSFLYRLELDHEGDFIDAWPEGFFPERREELFDRVDLKR